MGGVYNGTSPITAAFKDSPVVIKYHPPEGFNFWMVVMILVGCSFVLFVLASVYLVCKSKKSPGRPERQPVTAVTRVHTLRERHNPRERENLTVASSEA